VLVTANAALGDHGDVSKPLCADIHNFDAGYQSNVITATISVGETEATCKNLTYSLVVIVDEGSTPLVFSAPGTGTVGPVVIRSDAIADEDANVCVYVQVSKGGKDGLNKVIDLLPDAGQPCVTLTEEGSAGGAGHA
jgi:hypothetical protein